MPSKDEENIFTAVCPHCMSGAPKDMDWGSYCQKCLRGIEYKKSREDEGREYCKNLRKRHKLLRNRYLINKHGQGWILKSDALLTHRQRKERKLRAGATI